MASNGASFITLLLQKFESLVVNKMAIYGSVSREAISKQFEAFSHIWWDRRDVRNRKIGKRWRHQRVETKSEGHHPGI